MPRISALLTAEKRCLLDPATAKRVATADPADTRDTGDDSDASDAAGTAADRDTSHATGNLDGREIGKQPHVGRGASHATGNGALHASISRALAGKGVSHAIGNGAPVGAGNTNEADTLTIAYRLEATESNDTADTSRVEHLQYQGILATIGFALYFAWELLGIFGMLLPLATYLPLQEAVIARMIFLICIAISLTAAYLLADRLLKRCDLLFSVGTLLSCVPIIIALVSFTSEVRIPIGIVAFGWICLGISFSSLMLYWGSFFSLVPTRYTRVAIVSASTGGTFLFIIVACIASESIFLLSYALLAALSLALAYYLSLKIRPQMELSSQHFWPIPPTTWKRGLSIGSHSLAHGFVVTALFHMGFEAVIIGCASGLIGDALCFVWLRNKKIDVDVSLFQRITLPLILLGLLLFPVVSDTGRLLCCCLINICLAHFITMTWANSAVANSEFKFHPLKAFASNRIPNMLGFLVGTIYAVAIFFYFSLDTGQLYLAIAGIVVLIVSVSMIYGMDDSTIKRRLANLLTYENKVGMGVGDARAGVDGGGASGSAETDGALSERRVAWYRMKCEAIVERYDLSPREAEVFMLLAKGRTADYIGSKLVISNSTAKTHIYHIYQKLGINTQQRLMDIVEDDAGAGG